MPFPAGAAKQKGFRGTLISSFLTTLSTCPQEEANHGGQAEGDPDRGPRKALAAPFELREPDKLKAISTRNPTEGCRSSFLFNPVGVGCLAFATRADI